MTEDEPYQVARIGGLSIHVLYDATTKVYTFRVLGPDHKPISNSNRISKGQLSAIRELTLNLDVIEPDPFKER